jgi:predicted transcriptional regulator
MATTVRISDEKKEVLREIARKLKKTMQSVLEEAIECKRRQVFFDTLDEEYEKMSSQELYELRKEEQLYESTLSDSFND